MPEFEYLGVDKAGKQVKSKLNASTEGDLRMILRGQGIRPVKISKVGALNQDLGSLLRGGVVTVRTENLVAFTRQLHILISSGIPLVQAFEVLTEQTADKNLQNIIIAVKEKVSQGSYLWEALSAYPKVFPKLYIALIRAGEASGSMDQMLKRLSRYLEDADRLHKMIKSAMMYPVIVSAIGIGVVALMLVFVIPKFEEILKTNNQELPLITQVIINLSHFLINNILVVSTVTAASIFLLIKYIKSDEGRALYHRMMFNAPIFGRLMQIGGVARFSRTMQTLLSSGVNLIDAIDICKATIDNVVLEEAVSKIRGDVESGKTLGTVVGKLSVFPKMAVQMITVGETTGSLDKMLERVADFYEMEVETMVNGLSKLIEPLVLVFLGGAVGGIMIAMYLPIFKLAGGVS